MDYTKILNEAVNAVLPPACPMCGEPKPYRHGARVDICPHCADRIDYVKEPVCLKCGKGIEDDNAEYCRDCEKGNHVYEQAASVYEYSALVKNAIYKFKYDNKREYADTFAREIARRCGSMIDMWQPDMIVPVPIHEERLKKRGYNQAGLIAHELGAITGIEVNERTLVRVINTAPMKELGTTQRIKNLQNAFQVRSKDVLYKKILLVDDIYTTGATFDACAAALTDADADKVYGVSLCIGEGF